MTVVRVMTIAPDRSERRGEPRRAHGEGPVGRDRYASTRPPGVGAGLGVALGHARRGLPPGSEGPGGVDRFLVRTGARSRTAAGKGPGAGIGSRLAPETSRRGGSATRGAAAPFRRLTGRGSLPPCGAQTIAPPCDHQPWASRNLTWGVIDVKRLPDFVGDCPGGDDFWKPGVAFSQRSGPRVVMASGWVGVGLGVGGIRSPPGTETADGERTSAADRRDL